MSRQGKMHGSPFHVETKQYKYAIENENEDYQPKRIEVDCEFYSHGGYKCLKWNSGSQNCKYFKCRYYLKKHPRKENSPTRYISCMSCKYNSGKKCIHPKKPSSIKLASDEANYCCFFNGKVKPKPRSVAKNDPSAALVKQMKADEAEKRKTARKNLTKTVRSLKKDISDIECIIIGIEETAKSNALSEEELAKLNQTTNSQKSRLGNLKKQLRIKESTLRAIGGELD